LLSREGRDDFDILGSTSETGLMRDFTIHLTHRPGELARVANALSRTGVNLKSITGLTIGNQAVLRLIPDDVEAARSALSDGNIAFEENEIVPVLLENRAGELADLAVKLSNVGVNLQAIYVIGLDGDLVELAVGVDDVKKAKKALA
jgi:hypothetical protein